MNKSSFTALLIYFYIFLKVSIVFNSAATVRFDEKLRIATTINAGGTLETLKLVNEMTKLKVMFILTSNKYLNI